MPSLTFEWVKRVQRRGLVYSHKTVIDTLARHGFTGVYEDDSMIVSFTLRHPEKDEFIRQRKLFHNALAEAMGKPGLYRFAEATPFRPTGTFRASAQDPEPPKKRFSQY